MILASRELSAHMLVAGTTQAGKSTLLKRHVEGICRLGHSVLVLDGKADPALVAFLRGLSPHAQIWVPGGQVAPLDLLGGSPSEFAAKLIDVHRWTEPHYRAINDRFALQLGTYFALSGEPLTPAPVVRLLVPDNLDAAADGLSTRLRRAGDTARAKAALAITTYTADLLKRPAPPGHRRPGRPLRRHCRGRPGRLPRRCTECRLESLLAAPDMWYMGLPGDTMPDEVAALGAWLLLELARVAHYRRSAAGLDPQALLIVDELSALGHGALHLEPVLARARDAGIAVVVTTQALADVRALSATLPDQLLANTGIEVFSMRDREASWAPSALGSGEVQQETLSEDAYGGFVRRSRRTLTAPLVPARLLESFGVGDAMLSVEATATGGERRLERFRVALPGQRTRSTSVKATLLAVSVGVLVAALVPATGLLNPAVRDFARSGNVRSAEFALPAVTQPPTLRSPSPSPSARPASGSAVSATPSPVRSAPQSWRVGNTDHLGVYLRAGPDGPPLHAR